MTNRAKALMWAAIILGTAFLAKSQGLSDGASFALVTGLTGAAWGSINARSSCGRGCLQ